METKGKHKLFTLKTSAQPTGIQFPTIMNLQIETDQKKTRKQSKVFMLSGLSTREQRICKKILHFEVIIIKQNYYAKLNTVTIRIHTLYTEKILA